MVKRIRKLKKFKFIFLTLLVSLFTLGLAAQSSQDQEYLLNLPYETEEDDEPAETPELEAPGITVEVPEVLPMGEGDSEAPAVEEPEAQEPEAEEPEETPKENPKEEPKAEEEFDESKMVTPADQLLKKNNEEEIVPEAEKERPAWLEEILNSDKPFLRRLDFIMGFEPTLYVNTQKATTSAPSPITYPIYFGFHWPNDTFISFQPSFRIFTSYYLVSDVDGEKLVLPAEIENRTATTYSILFNMPVVFRVNFFDVTNIKAFGGIATLIRIPTLAAGLTEADKEATKDDMQYIKKWFMGGMRWLYLSAGADWMFNLPKQNLELGPEFSIFFPIGAVISDWSLDAIVISLGLKIVF